MSEKLVKMSSMQRDNLLINSDFRSGIINQKGEKYEGITTAKYTIDMWVLEPKKRDTSLYPQNGRLAIYQDGTNQNFNILQFVYGLILNQKYHLHFRYNDEDYDCNLIANNTSYNVKIDNNIEVLLSKIEDSKYTLAINFRNKQSNFIEYIKLEYGDYYTGMPSWNYSIELLKCQRYFQIYEGTFVQSLTSGTYFFGQQLRVMMAKDPLVKIRRLNSGNGTEISYKVKSMVCYKNLFDYIVLSASYNEIQIRGSFELDAYDY